MNRILLQKPIRSFTKKKFWTTTVAMLLLFMVLGALKAQAQTQTFCPGATVSSLASTGPIGATARWFTVTSGGSALSSSVALTTRTYYVEYSSPILVTTIATGFNNPTGIAVQTDGKILFADTNNNEIKRMNADGTNIVTLGTGFNRPRGVAVQADGKIVVADTGNNQIKRMNADGTSIVTLGAGFSNPWGVAIEFGDKILVADTINSAIKRINADGTTTTLGSGFINPTGIAVQIDDKIVVTDAGTGNVTRMNPDGTNIVNVGNGFFSPYSVSVQADGKIFVAETDNNAIIRMNGDGSSITTLSTDFNFPYGLAVQSAGVIVVTDSNNNSIKRISALVSIRIAVNVVVNSPVITNFAAIPTFCVGTPSPALATTSPNGVAGTWSPATISNTASRSYVFTPTLSCNTGQTLAVTVNPIPNPPIALATQVFAGLGTIATLTATGSTILWYNTATLGTPLPTSSSLVDGSTYYVSQIVSGCESPRRVAVTVKKISEATQTFCAPPTVANLVSTPSAGTTANWFTALSGGTALVSTAALTTGPYYIEQSNPLTITTLGSGFSFPYDVAVQADGKILVADTYNNAIKRMNANGTGIVILGSGFASPYGVAVQSDGKILVADSGNSAIKRMNADGTGIVTLGSGFSFPNDVAVQADGKILIADTYNNAIKRMNVDGTDIVTLALGFNFPNGVAVQADGKILVADPGNNAIKRMNADGTGIVILGSGFASPYGVAVQADGKILVADTDNNAIKRMNADGTGIVTLGSGFFVPYGVTVQSVGKILVVDTGNDAIKRITEAAVSNRVLVNVVNNSPVTSNFAAIPALCAGTTAPTLATTAPNGVAGTWSPATVSNTASGSYVFTPTAACNVGQTLAVTVNPVATSNFAAIPAFCVGTTAPTLATTSPNGVAGTWSPATISNTASGSYVFTPTAACNVGQTLAVTLNPVATSNFATIPAFCAGTTAPTLATTSPNGVAGTWSPATISNTASGSYVFTPTAACNVGQTLAVTVKTISASSTRIQVTCNGGSNGAIDLLNVSGGTAPYSYLWFNGATTASIFGLIAGTYSCRVSDSAGCSRVFGGLVISQPTAITTIITASDVTCNSGTNGTASIAVSGGTLGYTYNWTPGNPTGDGTSSVTGLAAGNYTCIVTDANGCQNTSFFNITQPATALNGTRVLTNSCFGGSTGAINLTTTGGTAPYTFNWGNGITTEDRTGLAAGTYSVIINDANGCTAIYSYIITQFGAITANTLQTNVSCRNGSNGTATIVASGGAGSYTYSWSPSGGTGATATGLVAGTYTCTVTDANACSIARAYSITQPTAIVTIITQTNVSCNSGTNGAASIAVSGGTSGYSYNWAPGNPAGNGTPSVTGLAAGNYTCTVTDANGCAATRFFNITQPTTALNGTTVVTNVSCFGGSTGAINLTPTGGTAPYTFNWGGGITTKDRTGLAAGTYSVTITDANGCTKTESFTIAEPNALPDNVSTISACDSFTWNGTIYNQTGIYTGPTANCVTEKLNLTINNSTTTSSTATACDSYVWFGTTYTASGTYTNTTTNASGCNNVETLTLTINSSTATSSTATACDSYVWFGTTYTASGTYTNTTTNASGCNNVETLTLTINSSTATSSTATACDSYVWFGTTYTASGTYTNTTTNALGCDNVETLTLTINNSTTTSSTAIACNSYVWFGTTYTASGTYTKTTTNASGCDNVETLTLTINTTPVISGNATQNFNVTDTLSNIIVSPISVIWYANLADANAGTSPLLATQVLTNNTTYYAVTTGNCPSVPFAVLVGTTLSNNYFNNQLNIKLYPNPSTGIFYLKLPQDLQIEIYNNLGQLLSSDKMLSGSNVIDIADKPIGVYFLKATDGNNVSTFKIIKN